MLETVQVKLRSFKTWQLNAQLNLNRARRSFYKHNCRKSFESLIIESAKLRALRAKNVLTCQRALRAQVPTWLACLRAHVPTC